MSTYVGRVSLIYISFYACAMLVSYSSSKLLLFRIVCFCASTLPFYILFLFVCFFEVFWLGAFQFVLRFSCYGFVFYFCLEWNSNFYYIDSKLLLYQNCHSHDILSICEHESCSHPTSHAFLDYFFQLFKVSTIKFLHHFGLGQSKVICILRLLWMGLFPWIMFECACY